MAGYSVEGTLAKHILTQPSEITSLAGKKLPLRMSVGEPQAAFTTLINRQHLNDLILIYTCTSGPRSLIVGVGSSHGWANQVTSVCEVC